MAVEVQNLVLRLDCGLSGSYIFDNTSRRVLLCKKSSLLRLKHSLPDEFQICSIHLEQLSRVAALLAHYSD